jgi:hypothetical protein
MDKFRHGVSLTGAVVFQNMGELDRLVRGIRLAPVQNACAAASGYRQAGIGDFILHKA